MDNLELAKETLKEAESYINKIILGIDEITEEFQAGREGMALNKFPDVIEGVQWLISVIELTQPLTNGLGIEFSSREEFNEKISEIVEALENRDYVLVGDLLNYEIKPILEEWQSTFNQIVKRIAENDTRN